MCTSQSCIEKLKLANEKNSKILVDAAKLAKETQKFVAIYTDEFGVKQLIQADQSAGYPIEQYISPEYRDTHLQ